MIGSLVVRMFQASFTFCQVERLAMALLRVMLMGLSPSWMMQPGIFLASVKAVLNSPPGAIPSSAVR